ncbi:MAG TPA: hypothetical protein PLA97_09260 [Rubrivivax sp.]|nr:hypothetical protein [Rubrivivax sp.]
MHLPWSFRALTLGSLALSAQACLAVVTGLTGGSVDGVEAASVMQLNGHGIGHVNLVPYYTVLDGFDTYLNLVNTDTRNGKAVKLRFRSAGNGDTVFDFTLLLSPGDMWAGALTQDPASGLPRLVHGDRSCTLPAQVQTTFGTARLDPSPQANPASVQAGEGYVEILTMADIPPRTGPADPPLFTAIRQVAGVAACTASALDPLAIDANSYPDARSKGLDVPTTGLMTRWTLINVARAAAYTGVATALEARVAANGPAGFGNIVLFPQTQAPVPSLALLRTYTTDPVLRGGVDDNSLVAGQNLDGVVPGVTALFSDLPDLSTPYLPSQQASSMANGVATRAQAQAISRALAVRSIANEYVINPAIAARTSWVISLPTRRYNAALAYGPQFASLRYSNWAADDKGMALASGTANYFGPLNTWKPDRILCATNIELAGAAGERQQAVFADAEGNLGSRWESPIVTIPVPFRLCGAAIRMEFVKLPTTAQVTGVLGRPNLYSDWAAFEQSLGGWARLGTPGQGQLGLPAIGFAAMELFNAAASPGFAGAYGQSFPHSMTPVP